MRAQGHFFTKSICACTGRRETRAPYRSWFRPTAPWKIQPRCGRSWDTRSCLCAAGLGPEQFHCREDPASFCAQRKVRKSTFEKIKGKLTQPPCGFYSSLRYSLLPTRRILQPRLPHSRSFGTPWRAFYPFYFPWDKACCCTRGKTESTTWYNIILMYNIYI